MILSKPLEIESSIISQLESAVGKMLLVTKYTRFFMIAKFETEKKNREEVIKPWFSKSYIKKSEIYYLTSINIWTYDVDNEFWGMLTEEAVIAFFYLYDILKLRNSFKKYIKIPIDKLGFNIIKKLQE